ncbi:FG-GAP repeat domain-containing protein [Paenarthrobacter sp. NPDC092416]|uniref:FG-GAP repeat domain-containing protein n=1 Tax=Paenarthrobacter sp. NPDC092416 TaxID=3364386 RepID=UPI00381E660F
MASVKTRTRFLKAWVTLVAALATGATLGPTSAVAAEADVPWIEGRTVVGNALRVSGAEAIYKDCSSLQDPGYKVQWLRDGHPVETRPDHSEYLYALESDDLGSRISAVLTGSTPVCGSRQITVAASDAIRKAVPRSLGFTGSNTVELLARRKDGTMFLYLADDKGKGWKDSRLVGPGWGSFTHLVAPGDLNTSDFWGEINDVLVWSSSGSVRLLPGTGDGGFQTGGGEFGSGWNVFNQIVGPGDFDGDGFNDLLARDSSGNLYLYPINAYEGWLPRTVVGWGWHVMDAIITPGDFDGDGNVDLLARDKAGQLLLYRGDGKGGWAGSDVVGWGWDVMTQIGSAGDFNHDGRADVHAVNKDGNLVMYYGNGAGGWLGADIVGWGWDIFDTIL